MDMIYYLGEKENYFQLIYEKVWIFKNKCFNLQ